MAAVAVAVEGHEQHVEVAEVAEGEQGAGRVQVCELWEAVAGPWGWSGWLADKEVVQHDRSVAVAVASVAGDKLRQKVEAARG